MTFLSRHEFKHYLNLLLRSSEVRQQTDALQDLFFMSLRGVKFYSDYWEDLMPFLVQGAKSNDTDLRRWSYKLASLCRSAERSQDLIKHCKNNLDLQKDSDKLNRTWMVSILAQHLEVDKFRNIISNTNHALTSENIDLAKYLFQRDSKVDMKRVWKRLDPLSLMWVAQIGAYNTIADINKVQSFITKSDLTRILAETDDDDALRASMYAFYLQKTFNVNDLPFKPNFYQNMGKQQMKWFFSTIWKDEKFIFNNIGFAEEIIFNAREFSNKTQYLGLSDESSKEVRVGIARGLSNSKYIKEVTSDIVDWHEHERSQSVKYYLNKYIINYQHRASAFKGIVEDQQLNGDSVVKELIQFNMPNYKKVPLLDTKEVSDKKEARLYSMGVEMREPHNNNPSVFVSYNWGDSTFVDEIESSLHEIANIHRDKNNIHPWGSITEFMKTIRVQDFVVLVISDAYLKSSACLYEVVQLMKDDIWTEKTMYVVMDDAKDIYNDMVRADYVKYWAEKCKELEQKIKDMPIAATVNSSEDLKKYNTILLSIGEFMAKISDANNPTVAEAVIEIRKHITMKY